MKSLSFVGFVAAPVMVLAWALPAYCADTAMGSTCKDGTTSTVSGHGACSGHGGVQKATKEKAAKATAPAEAATAAPAPAAASGAMHTCKDGTTSTVSGRGACSGHGGVQKATKEKASAAAVTAAPAAAAVAAAPAAAATEKAAVAAKSSVASKSIPTETAGSTDPTGATAKCKDGTFSHSQHHGGSCSNHGGVADWLTAPK